ncbi:MAG: OmpH family outer membrane protein [Flavobacteriales bacterium]
MKCYTGIAILMLLTSGFSESGFAQSKLKIGHIDKQAILLLMPERADAEKALQDYAKELEGKLTTMTTEYQNKVTAYQDKAAKGEMSGLIKETTEKEIIELENRIQTFRNTANESLAKKESELLKPMVDKIDQAIAEVAKANAYSYIFDSGQGTGLLYSPEGDDIASLVKKKLGIQ